MLHDPNTWARTKGILGAALKCPRDERPAFLDRACGADAALRAEVDSLLAAHAAAGEFGERSPVHALVIADEHTAASEEAREWLLAPGDRLGPYRIDARLGSGGMGQVYKASDLRLHRDVAIKILPPDVRADPHLRQRFEREARAIAALRHPHVCTLHDVGQEGDLDFLVMEYLDGESLADRLTTGPLPLGQAFRYAIEIADALAEVHRQGIIHRDLKPANIILTSAGAKILDFGTAKQQLRIASRAAWETTDSLTTPATIVGTLHYMAPEQLEGQNVDARADIFAFGALLYEMVSGRRAFRGTSYAAVVAAILEREPEPHGGTDVIVPPPLDRLIVKCLRKHPDERWQNAGEITDELRRISEAWSGGRRRIWSLSREHARAATWIAAVVLLCFGGALVWWSGAATKLAGRGHIVAASAGSEAVTSSSIGNLHPLTRGEALEIDPSFSPDGKFVAYSAGNANAMRVYLRSVTGDRAIPLTDGADALEYQPRWSPDGNEILYVTGQGVYVSPGFGGTPQRIDTPDDGVPYSGEHMHVRVTDATWSPDGRHIAVAHGGALVIVARGGNEAPRLIARAPSDLHHCSWSRDGRWIACTQGNWHYAGPGGTFGNRAPSQIVIVASAGGELREVTDAAAQNQSPVWAPDSRVLYFVSNRQGTFDVYAQEMSAEGRAVGSPSRMTTGLGVYSMTFSSSGKQLAYAAYSSRANIFSVPIPKTGIVDVSEARAVTTGNQTVESMIVSRDLKWLYYDSTLSGNADIFRIPTAGGRPERLTTGPDDNFGPDPSPDGRFVAYSRPKIGGIFVQPLDGGPVERATTTPDHEAYPNWSPDSQAIVFFNFSKSGGEHFGVVRRKGNGQWGTAASLPFLANAEGFIWSRDGTSLVCTKNSVIWTLSWDSRERRDVYRPAPGGAGPPVDSIRQDVSGDPLYFKSHDKDGITSFWSVPMAGGRPRRLVTLSDPNRQSSRFDFNVDATHFYFSIEERSSNIWLADVIER